ncbi:fatty acid amide hydrolase-like protein [Tanacetum coccineum]
MCNISTNWDDEIYHATRCEALVRSNFQGNQFPLATQASRKFVISPIRRSVRMPASLFGVVGLKPSFGRVPHLGVIPWNLEWLDTSQDTPGFSNYVAWEWELFHYSSSVKQGT